MKTNDTDNKKMESMLESLKLPEVQMPAHQRRLSETLLTSGYFGQEDVPFSTRQKISRDDNMKPKVWKLAASFAALLLAVGVYMTFFAAPQAVASLALQVNPAVTLTLSERNTVIDAVGLDAQGESLLAGLDVTGKQIPEALRTIAEALRETGLLEEGRRVLIALHPVGGRLGEAELTALTGTVHQAFDSYIAEHGLPVDVVSVSLTAELAAVVCASGLLPADYVDLAAVVGSPMAMQVLNLQKELGLDPTLFKEEFGTIAAALIDMKEAGITGDDALVILRGTLIADPKLEELTTITAAMIDLIEEGLRKDEALAIIQAAIKADPTLQNFDDLIEAPRNEEEDQHPRPRPPVKPEPDKPEAEVPGEDPVKPEPDKPEAEVPGED